MSILSENITVANNSGHILIEESPLSINESTKYCIMGVNGSGKSTLMNRIYNRLINIRNKESILLFDQDIKIDTTDQTILEFMLDTSHELFSAYQQTTELSNKENDMTDNEYQTYTTLQEYMCVHEWDKYDAEARRVLNGLQFNNIHLPVSKLSGGWQKRLALGRILFCKPTILLLDEPTNDIDLHATIWLEDYLQSYSKTLIVVTHDRKLVSSIADVIWYIGNLRDKPLLHTIRGNSELDYVQETYATNLKLYESYVKKLQEFKSTQNSKKNKNSKITLDDFVRKHFSPRPPKQYKVAIEFDPITSFSSKNVIECKQVEFSYDTNLLDPFDFSISLDSRIAVVGKNGMGKSTLFKLIMGQVQPTSGSIVRDDRVKIAYYHQKSVDNIPFHLTPIEYLQQLDSSLSIGDCRGKLGKVGLKKIDGLDPCTTLSANLSGGQKVRVSLCAIVMSQPSILLFDEISNNLDYESIEAVIDGINNFNGAVVIISLDAHLLSAIENCKIYTVDSGKIAPFHDDFYAYTKYVLNSMQT